MKSSASESKPFQSRSKGEIPGLARREERSSGSKLKQAFLIDSDAELFMYLVRRMKSSAAEPDLRKRVKDKDRPVDRKRNIKEDTEMLRLSGYLHSLQCEAGGKLDILGYLLENFLHLFPL